VKAHGALYNSAVSDSSIARTIVMAVKMFNPGLRIFGPSGSALEKAAKMEKMSFVSEVFADRGYNDDASLVARGNSGAIIHNVHKAASRVMMMMTRGRVESVSGKLINITAQTICLHGDNEKAVIFAKELHYLISKSGVSVKSH